MTKQSPSQSLDVQSRLKLNNGVEIPRLGLGVYQAATGKETEQAVLWALEAGYRHIDTASVYGNERDVNSAISASGLPRDQIFITTKVWNDDQGFDNTLKAFDKSAKRLGVDFVDLYLIHWPAGKLRDDTWRALIQLGEEGKCRSIGVSNYTTAHLTQLLSWSQIVPAINQVEFSPFLFQKQLLELCEEDQIILEAYSPLTQGKKLDDPTLVSIARKHEKTAAQILIRWVIQHGMIVIPKSVHQERIVENANVFDFSIAPDDMAALDALDEGFRTCWDPTNVR